MVVGLCWYDSQIGDAFFNLIPGYETFAPNMIAYAEKRLCKEDGSLTLNLLGGQQAFMHEAKKRGYQLASEEVEGIYDFSKSKLNYALPKGFHFKPLAEQKSLTERMK